MDNNPELNGEQAETPTTSPVEMTTPGVGETVNPQGAENQSPEEESWSSLSGQAQDRFRQVTRTNSELRRELDTLKGQVNTISTQVQQPAYNYQQPTPEVADAVKKLDEFGMATKDYVTGQVDQKVNQRLNGLIYQMEIDRLATKYDGSNGLPNFDKVEYEEYVATHPQFNNYDPEDVYKKMYEPEYFDWQVQNHGRNTTRRTSPSLRPTKTQVREEQLTPELIEARLKEPDGRQWYEANLNKINSALQRTAPTE